MKKLVIIITSILLVFLLALFVLSQIYLNAENAERYLEGELGEEFRVEVADVSFNLFTRRVSLDGMSVSRVRADAEQALFRSGTLSLSGIDLPAAWRGELFATSLLLDDFDLNGDALLRGAETGYGRESSVDITLETVDLQNGRVTLSPGKGGSGEVRGVRLSARSVQYRTACDECSLWSVLPDLELDIEAAEFTTENGYYTIDLQDVAARESDGTVSIGGMRVVPLLSDDEFLDELEYRADYFRFDLSGFRVRDFDFGGWREEGHLVGSKAEIDELDLLVTNDRRLPENPDRESPPLPADKFLQLPVGISIDTLQVHHAEFRYSEYASDGVRPGTILFAETYATLLNADNRSGGTAVFHVRSLLEGEGVLETEFRFRLREEQPDVWVTGSLGRFTVPLLNNIFKDVEGIRLTGGQIDRLDFDYTMEENQSEGTIYLAYEGLGIEHISKDDYSQNIGDQVLGFFTDQIVLRASADSEGEIQVMRDKERGFFNYLWASLRSGIFDVTQRI